MPSVTIDLTEVHRFAAAVRGRAPGILREELGQAVATSGALVHREAVLRSPVDTGTLRASVSARVDGLQVEIGTPIEYGAPVELGVRPGGGRPPLGAIARWAQRKLGLAKEASYAFATAFREKARARGIGAQPFLAPAFDDNLGLIGMEFDFAAGRAVGRIAALGR